MPVTDTAPPQPCPAHELKTLVLSRHALICIETLEEERVDALVREVAGELGITVFDWTVTRGLVRDGETAASYGTQDAKSLARSLGGLSVEAIFVLKDIGPHLGDPAASRAFRETVERIAAPGRLSTLVCTGAAISLPAELEALAIHFRLRPPEPADLRRVVFAVMDLVRDSGRAEVDLTPDDVDGLVDALRGMTLNQARQAVAHAALHDGRLTRGDIDHVVERKAAAMREGGLLEYFPPADNVAALGGFDRLRAWLDRARVGFGEEAAALRLEPPRGLLLVGVQGCGKSLAAKAVAAGWKLPLLKLDAGSLYDKYIGETERNFRRATAQAESMSPCVLWIDEIEKAFASSGGDDGGVSRRVLGSFLTWLAEKEPGVFVVATANDLSSIPPELMRKGRFDEIFFVDLPDAGERAEIFAIHLRLRRQDPETFDLDRLVAASEGFSGAEIEQAVITGLYAALHEGEPPDGSRIEAELEATVPLSVSRVEDVARLRDTARERFVPVR